MQAKFDQAGIKLEDLGTVKNDGLHITLESGDVVISFEDLNKNSYLGQNNVWQYRNTENTQVLYAFDKENKILLEASKYVQLDRMNVEGYIRVDNMTGLDKLARITEMLSMPFPENTYFPPIDIVNFEYANRQDPNFGYPFGELPEGMVSFLRIANFVIVGKDPENGRPYESVAVLQHAYNADDKTFGTIKYVKDIIDPEKEIPIEIQIAQEKTDGSGILLPHISLSPES
ncbi:MAG: hypothetical protein IPG44_16735 [Anaerolineales bacterium]|nr:hypothetical protein [Anaerolineales bacterium]